MSGSLPIFRLACAARLACVLTLMFLVYACTGAGDLTDVGWVNVGVADVGTRMVASFVVAQQQCDRQEVADCVISALQTRRGTRTRRWWCCEGDEREPGLAAGLGPGTRQSAGTLRMGSGRRSRGRARGLDFSISGSRYVPAVV